MCKGRRLGHVPCCYTMSSFAASFSPFHAQKNSRKNGCLGVWVKSVRFWVRPACARTSESRVQDLFKKSTKACGVSKKSTKACGVISCSAEPDVPAQSAADARLHAALADGTIRLLSCAWLRAAENGFVVLRHQEMPADALLPPEAAAQAFGAGDRRVGVLSYGWLTRHHPDPLGQRATHVLAYLRSPEGLRFDALFWDFGCLPEPDSTGCISDADLALQRKAFSHMAELYASADGAAVIRLTLMPPPQAPHSYNLRPLEERGWCVFEMYVAMIVVGTDAQSCTRHETPKLLDATGGAVPDITAAPTPEEFAARLDIASFTVESDIALAKQLYLDYYLENGVGARARKALEMYKRWGRDRRQRIRYRVLGVGLPLITIGAVVRTINLRGLGVELIEASFLVLGAAICGLALQPDEGKIIRRVTTFAVVALAAVITRFLYEVAEYVHELLTRAPLAYFNGTWSDHPDRDSDEELYRHMGQRSVRTLILSLAIAYVMPTLLYRGTPRAALLRMITAFRAACMALTSLTFFGDFALVCVGSASFFAGKAGPRMTVNLFAFAIGALFTPANRRRLQALFALAGSSRQAVRAEREAAALAALVGGGSQQVDDAASSFRLLPLHGLDVRDLPGSGMGPADAAALIARTHAAALGAPRSVFVSHSWHDSREAKWAALRAWAARYEAEHGAPPMLWLDAACVPQDSSTDRSLALLPLYIAGCQHMLVLAGSTFIERLWCVIEIFFCFLRMGGTLDRITVVPVLAAAAQDEEGWAAAVSAARARFAQFDVANASCAREEDTQRLLACIEMGFGTYEPFNKLVQQTFQDRAEFAPIEVPPTGGRRTRFLSRHDRRTRGPNARHGSVTRPTAARATASSNSRLVTQRSTVGSTRV